MESLTDAQQRNHNKQLGHVVCHNGILCFVASAPYESTARCGRMCVAAKRRDVKLAPPHQYGPSPMPSDSTSQCTRTKCDLDRHDTVPSAAVTPPAVVAVDSIAALWHVDHIGYCLSKSKVYNDEEQSEKIRSGRRPSSLIGQTFFLSLAAHRTAKKASSIPTR
eukprot:gene4204-3036_t